MRHCHVFKVTYWIPTLNNRHPRRMHLNPGFITFRQADVLRPLDSNTVRVQVTASFHLN